MSLDQLHWQQLESDEGRVVGCFVSECRSAKWEFKAFVAILIKTNVFWLPQEYCSLATRGGIERPRRADRRTRWFGLSRSFACLMTEDEGISLTVSYNL